MKKVSIIIILSVFFLNSCKDIKNNTAPRKNEFKTSSSINDKEKLSTENTVKQIQLYQNCDETFEDFFGKFSRDSIFQKNRIKYPLRELYTEDLESTETQINLIDTSKYQYRDFTVDKDAINNEFDKYNISIEKINDSSIHYKHLGYDNGIHVIYKFSIIEGCWYLIEIEDKSA